MRRISPLLLAIACLMMLIGGAVWKITSADGCMKQGGTITGAMTRSQHCVGNQ
jgi:hypothetical protein